MARITDTAVAGLEKDPADWRGKVDSTPGPMPKRPSMSSSKKASPEPKPEPTIEEIRNSAVDKALGGREMDVEELESRQMERFRASEGEGGGVYSPGGGRRVADKVSGILGLPSVGSGATPTRDMDAVRRRHGAMESIDVPAGGSPTSAFSASDRGRIQRGRELGERYAAEERAQTGNPGGHWRKRIHDHDRAIDAAPEYTTRSPSDPPSPYKHTLAEEGLGAKPKWMEHGIAERGPETLKMLEERGDAAARAGVIGDKGRATKAVNKAVDRVVSGGDDHVSQNLIMDLLGDSPAAVRSWKEELARLEDRVVKRAGSLNEARANLKRASEVAKKKLAELKNLPKMADFHPKDVIRALQNVDMKAAAKGLVDDPFTLIALANVPGMMFVSGLPDTTENYRTLARMGSDTRAPGPLRVGDLDPTAREELAKDPELVLDLYESGHISEELRSFLDIGPRFQYAPLEE